MKLTATVNVNHYSRDTDPGHGSGSRITGHGSGSRVLGPGSLVLGPWSWALGPGPCLLATPRTLPATLPVPVHAMLVAQRCTGEALGSLI